MSDELSDQYEKKMIRKQKIVKESSGGPSSLGKLGGFLKNTAVQLTGGTGEEIARKKYMKARNRLEA